jgi:hypothetical protein
MAGREMARPSFALLRRLPRSGRLMRMSSGSALVPWASAESGSAWPSDLAFARSAFAWGGHARGSRLPRLGVPGLTGWYHARTTALETRKIAGQGLGIRDHGTARPPSAGLPAPGAEVSAQTAGAEMAYPGLPCLNLDALPLCPVWTIVPALWRAYPCAERAALAGPGSPAVHREPERGRVRAGPVVFLRPSGRDRRNLASGWRWAGLLCLLAPGPCPPPAR